MLREGRSIPNPSRGSGSLAADGARTTRPTPLLVCLGLLLLALAAGVLRGEVLEIYQNASTL